MNNNEVKTIFSTDFINFFSLSQFLRLILLLIIFRIDYLGARQIKLYQKHCYEFIELLVPSIFPPSEVSLSFLCVLEVWSMINFMSVRGQINVEIW